MKLLRTGKKKAIADKIKLTTQIADGSADIPSQANSATLAKLQTAATNLGTAAQNAADRANAAKAAMDTQHAMDIAWNDALEAHTANLENDKTMTVDQIHKLGLEVASGRQSTTQEIQIPQNLVLKLGKQHGELVAHWDSVPLARGYMLEVTLTPNDAASWEQAATSTKCTCTLVALTTGTTYYVRVHAFGAAGEGPDSSSALAVAP